MAVLLVDDDRDMIDVVTYILRREGYEVIAAYDGDQGWAMFQRDQPELVVLDANMPGIDGMEVCRRIRDIATTPVIMLTARTDEADIVRALGLGADDYITKPFSTRELLARVRAMLRRAPSGDEPSDVLLAGPLRIDLLTHRVSVHGRPLEVSPTEFRLLQFFVTHPERVYSRSQLLDEVWGNETYIEERTVDVHIRRLRKLLEPFDCAELIQTVRSVGYRFSRRAE